MLDLLQQVGWGLTKTKHAIPLQWSSGISTACKSLEPVSYMYPPAVKEKCSSSRQIWAGGWVPGKSGQAGLGSCGSPSTSEAKLILRLRPLCCGSAKACSPAAAGNCLQCRCPWNGYGSPSTAPLCAHLLYSTGKVYIWYLCFLKLHSVLSFKPFWG